MQASSSDRSIVLQAEKNFWINDAFDPNILASGVGKALRLYSMSGTAGAGSGLIGYWNIRSNDGKVGAIALFRAVFGSKNIQVDDLVTVQDIWEIIKPADTKRAYVLRSQHTERVYTVSVSAGASPDDIQLPVIPIMLEAFEFEILSISPIENGIAAMGLVDKYNPLAGLGRREHIAGRTQIDVKCCGTLGFFVVDDKPTPACTIAGSNLRLTSKNVAMSMGRISGSLFEVVLGDHLPTLTVIIEL